MSHRWSRWRGRLFTGTSSHLFQMLREGVTSEVTQMKITLQPESD